MPTENIETKENKLKEENLPETSTPITENVEINKPSEDKKSFYKSCKFQIILLALLAIIIALGTIWTLKMYDTYKKAKTYKEGYDLVLEQKDRCAKVLNGDLESKEEFTFVQQIDYCRQLNKAFEKIQKVEEK